MIRRLAVVFGATLGLVLASVAPAQAQLENDVDCWWWETVPNAVESVYEIEGVGGDTDGSAYKPYNGTEDDWG